MNASVAAVRPDDWNLPLFVHVLGAMAVMGTLLLAALLAFESRRQRDSAAAAPLRRATFRALLLGVLPSYLVMRIAAQWAYSAEGFGETEDEPAWLEIGYATTDGGALFLLIALVLSGVAVRRARTEPAGGATLTRISGGIAWLLLGLYVVVVWAMTVKPD